MRIKLKDQQKDQQCVKIRQFQYTQGKVKRSSIRKVVDQNPIPIQVYINQYKAIIKKMSSDHRIDQLLSNDNLFELQLQQAIDPRRKSLSYKKFITPRDQLYKPRPSVFQRFSYQNYENYSYRNPFKPTKFQVENHIVKPPRKDIKKGTTKNIEIVFCENKFQDFVEKANQQIEGFYQNKSRETRKQSNQNVLMTKRSARINQTSSLFRSSSLPPNLMSRTHSTVGHSINLNRNILKTTLSRCMQEFNTLQKLSSYMELQQKHSEKYLLNKADCDPTKTVLIQILTHRFSFLNLLNKKTKNLIYKSLLGSDSVYPYSKISIHDYIRFLQIFIFRDANVKQLAFFIFNFLFRDSEQVSFGVAKKVLDMLPGSSKNHAWTQNSLFEMIRQSEGNQELIFKKMLNDTSLLNCIIDLIVNK